MEGTYTRKKYTDGGDIHAEGLTHGGDIYILQTVQMFWIIYLAAYLLDGLTGPVCSRKINKQESSDHSLDKNITKDFD